MSFSSTLVHVTIEIEKIYTDKNQRMNQKKISKTKRNYRMECEPTEMEKYRDYWVDEIKILSSEPKSLKIKAVPDVIKELDNTKDPKESLRLLETRIKENEKKAKKLRKKAKEMRQLSKWGVRNFRTYKVWGSRHQDIKDSCIKGSDLVLEYDQIIIKFQGETDLTMPRNVVSLENINLREIWIRFTREKTSIEEIFPNQKYNENYFLFSVLIIDDESVVDRKTGFINKPVEIDFYIDKDKEIYPQLCEKIYNRNLPLKVTKEFMELLNFLVNFIHFIGCAERRESRPFEVEHLFDDIRIHTNLKTWIYYTIIPQDNT